MNEYEIKYRHANSKVITTTVIEAYSLDEAKKELLEIIGWCEFMSIKPLTY